jgi:hypothetical protein
MISISKFVGILLLPLILAAGSLACIGDPSGLGESPVEELDASEPDADEPDADEPDASEPDASEPDADEPVEPDADRPDAGEPDADRPDADEPDADEPDADEPCEPGFCQEGDSCTGHDDCDSTETIVNESECIPDNADGDCAETGQRTVTYTKLVCNGTCEPGTYTRDEACSPQDQPCPCALPDTGPTDFQGICQGGDCVCCGIAGLSCPTGLLQCCGGQCVAEGSC